MKYEENLKQISKEIYNTAAASGGYRMEWSDNCAKLVVEKFKHIFELGYEHGFSNALMGGKPVQSCLDLQILFGLTPNSPNK